MFAALIHDTDGSCFHATEVPHLVCLRGDSVQLLIIAPKLT